MSTRYLLFFRVMLAGALLLSALQSTEPEPAFRWICAALPVYLAASAALWAQERFRTLPPRWRPWTLGLDLGAALAASWSLPGRASDLFPAYLLIVLGSTLMRRPALSFSLAAVSAAAFLGFTDPDDAGRWAKTALLGAAPFFGSFLANYLGALVAPLETRMAWLERLALAGRALSSVLHEVKTPLGTISLSTAAIRRRLARGEDVEEQLRLIESEVERASEILVNFLEFTKAAPPPLSARRLSDSLERALAAMAARAEQAGLRLESGPAPDSIVDASERHLVQVFTNLLDNAIRAAADGGRVRVLQTEAAGRAVVTIEDDGKGIEPERLAELLDGGPGVRADGYGIGLSVARWIVEKHGGTLSLFSDGPGRGCRAVVELPLRAKS